MNAAKKAVLRIVAFCLALLACVLLAGNYLMPHSNRYLEGYTAGGILGEDFDTIDVLVIGDSNAAQGIAPMKWYDKHGITGYTYGAAWFTVYNAYYRLKDIYQEQAPQVVVLCTEMVYSKRGSETYFDSAVNNIAGELMPLLRYHDNWKELNAENFLQPHDYSWRDANKGFMPLTGVVPYQGGDYMYDQGVASIPLLAQIYLDRIVALCEEQGSELLLITVPAATSWNRSRHNGIQAYADARGLTYIDYNLDPQGMLGLDWSTDTPDTGSHLNVLGAVKLTDALGEYLTGRYSLPDHRGQAGYEHWQQDAEAWAETMAKAIPGAQKAAGQTPESAA